MFSYNFEKIHFKTFDQIDRVTGRNSNSNSNTLELLAHSFSLWLFLLEPLPVWTIGERQGNTFGRISVCRRPCLIRIKYVKCLYSVSPDYQYAYCTPTQPTTIYIQLHFVVYRGFQDKSSLSFDFWFTLCVLYMCVCVFAYLYCIKLTCIYSGKVCSAPMPFSNALFYICTYRMTSVT